MDADVNEQAKRMVDGIVERFRAGTALTPGEHAAGEAIVRGKERLDSVMRYLLAIVTLAPGGRVVVPDGTLDALPKDAALLVDMSEEGMTIFTAAVELHRGIVMPARPWLILPGDQAGG